MLPLGMVNFIAVAIFQELRAYYDPANTSLMWTLLLAVAAWVVCFAAWAVVSIASPLVTDNRRRLDMPSQRRPLRAQRRSYRRQPPAAMARSTRRQRLSPASNIRPLRT